MNPLDTITEIVANYYEFSPDDIKSKTRKREYVTARQLCYAFALRYTKNSLKSIGTYYGKRDHSTVIHGRDTINDLYDTSKEMIRDYDNIKLILDKTFDINSSFKSFETVYIVTEETIRKAYPDGRLPAKCKKIDKIEHNEIVNTLIASCEEGMDGRWDCGTAEGKESFQPMIDQLETLLIN